MAMQPECIVLDEPTAMLDPNGRKEVLRAVRKLNEEKGRYGYSDYALHGRGCFCGPCVRYGQRQTGNAGDAKGDFSEVEKLKELRLDVPQVTLLAYELRKKMV